MRKVLLAVSLIILTVFFGLGGKALLFSKNNQNQAEIKGISLSGKFSDSISAAVPVNALASSIYQDIQGDVAISGKLGIGTANPLANLDVAGAVRFGQVNSIGGTAYSFGFTRSSGNMNYPDISGNGSAPLVIAGKVDGSGITAFNGLVGIGTVAPGFKLDIDDIDKIGGLQVKSDSAAGLRVMNRAGSKIALLANTNTGYVGIGTAFPGAVLDIKANSTTWNGWNETIRLSDPNHDAITFPAGGLLFGMHYNRIFHWADTTNGWYDMTLDAPTGNLWIKGTLSQGSSRDTKKDIQSFAKTDYENILQKALNTDVVNYKYKTEDANTKPHIGVIAENSPSEITSDDQKSIRTSDYLGFLLAAIKAQQQEIQQLKDEVKQLQENR